MAKAGTIDITGTITLGIDEGKQTTVVQFSLPVMFNAHLTTDTNGQPVVHVAPSLEPRIRKACEAFIEAFNTTDDTE
jgi:hypothetical protein